MTALLADSVVLKLAVCEYFGSIAKSHSALATSLHQTLATCQRNVSNDDDMAVDNISWKLVAPFHVCLSPIGTDAQPSAWLLAEGSMQVTIVQVPSQLERTATKEGET